MKYLEIFKEYKIVYKIKYIKKIALLPETTIRDLNDEINKQLKQKFFWEKQILDLGGPNYIAESKKLEAQEKKYSIGNYKYFGAARKLPGVKELFEDEEPKIIRRSRRDIFQTITCEYYGFRDEDDGNLISDESKAEILAIQQEITRQKDDYENRIKEKAKAKAAGSKIENDSDEEEEDDFSMYNLQGFISLPNQNDINKLINKRRGIEVEKETTIEEDEN